MTERESNSATVDQYIMYIVKNKQAETVEHIVKQVQSKYPMAEQKIIDHILRLQKQGKMEFKEHSSPPPSTFMAYISTVKATWYWVVIALSFVTGVAVLFIAENAFPIVYLRYALGSIFVVFLPGYCLIKMLFPEKELNNLEQIVLSVATSIFIVFIIGIIYNYTPWGITQTPTTLTLLALTVTFATTTIILQYKARSKERI